VVSKLEPVDPDPETWALGEERPKILTELAMSQRTTRAAVIAAAQELGIHRSQCYELLRRFRHSPTVTSLLPRTPGRGRGVRMLKPEVEAVVETAIDEFYLSRRCPTMADLMRDIAQRCASLDLQSPTYNSVAQRVRARVRWSRSFGQVPGRIS